MMFSFSPQGDEADLKAGDSYIISGSTDCTFKLWSLKTGEILHCTFKISLQKPIYEQVTHNAFMDANLPIHCIFVFILHHPGTACAMSLEKMVFLRPD